MFTTKVHANADRHRQNIAIEKEKKEKDFSHNISKVVAGREFHLFVFSSSEQKGGKGKKKKPLACRVLEMQ